MESIVIKKLFDFVQNRKLRFHLYFKSNTVEENTSISSIHFSEDSVILYLENNNSYEISSSSITLIGYDAFSLKTNSIDSLKEPLESFQEDQVRVVYLEQENRDTVWQLIFINNN